MRVALTLGYCAAQFRARAAHYLLAVCAIAIGVALALAIHLVNQSALSEFADALAKVNGQAQLRITASIGETLDDSVFERLVAGALASDQRLPIQALSPVLDLPVQVVADGATTPLRVLGIDPFRAAQVALALMPLPADEAAGSGSALFRDDALFLSAAASQRLRVLPGDRVELRHGRKTIALRVAGSLPGVSQDQMLAVMDIGTMQWRFDLIGKISYIDLLWRDDATATTVANEASASQPQRERELQSLIGANAKAVRPELEGQKISNLSRAYRVNLTVLSLVALLTGAYIVFTTLSLSVARQRRGLAVLGVLGMAAREIEQIVLAQAVLLGIAGALIGLVLGITIASVLLQTFGADLGGGYFRGLHPALRIDPLACALFAALGVLIALLGAWLPARAARASSLAGALRGYGSAMASRRSVMIASGIAALAGGLLLLLPPVRNLPIPAYAAIALWLLAGIGFSSLLASALAALLTAVEAPLSRHLPLWLAANRIAAANAGPSSGKVVLGHGSSAGTAIAGVVASFALASAMAIMVHSFRESVAVWLDQVLPADLYVRASQAGAAASLDRDWQASATILPGIKRIEYLRVLELTVRDDKPKASLLARPLQAARIEQQLPLSSTVLPAPPGSTPIYLSEVASALFVLRVGDRIALSELAANESFFVAAIWRDYARQNGAIAIALDDYRRLTGDQTVNELAIWQTEPSSLDATVASLTAAAPAGVQLQWRSAAQLRSLSLQIFDRSFVLTYVLEAIAILVGLFGVATSFASDALSRAREFAVLRYLGMPRPSLLLRIATEAFLLLTVATVAAMVLGTLIATVLVFVVNPQSFFWTMEMRLPWGLLAASCAGLMFCGTVAALIGARAVMAPQLTQALKEDW